MVRLWIKDVDTCLVNQIFKCQSEVGQGHIILAIITIRICPDGEISSCNWNASNAILNSFRAVI